jgi:NtrC-family two-component system sensor histidine kinase KinB
VGGLTRKLFVGFGGVAGVLLFVGVILVGFLTFYSQYLQSGLRENYDSVLYCDRMKDALDQAQTFAQTEVFTNESPNLTSVANLRDAFLTQANAEIHNCTLPGEAEKSQIVLQAGTAYFAAFDRLAKAPPDLKVTLYRTEMLPNYSTGRQALEDIAQMNLSNFAQVNTTVRNSLLLTRNTVTLVILLGLALALMFVVLTARSMIQPLIQLTASVRQVEAGNLDSVVEVSDDDEIGVLAHAFNAMAAKLREFRRLDHERLARTQKTTQVAIDSLPDAVAVIDPDGMIEIANRTARVHFGLEPGTNIAAVRPDWAAAFFTPVLESGQPHVSEGYRSAIQLFDGSGERFLLPKSVPMFDDHDNVIGVTLVLVEVTHLRRADEFKSGLLSTVSHELKTPLTSVRMAVRLLLDKRIGELNEQQQTLLTAARADSERLVKTIDDILTIGRVEAGYAKLNMTVVRAREIVDRAISSVDSLLKERGIRIEQHLPAAETTVRVDITMMSCALINILSNAAKYAPAQSAIFVSLTGLNERVEFSVRDQGPGIPAEFQGRVFEKFFRIPAADAPTGVGLGLSIAKEIVELHQGTIHLQSESMQGSIFSIRMPRVE